MNYKLKIENGVSVIETATEQVIKHFDNMDSARKFMRHLNLGGAFDGWSPSFILKSVVKK
jgi:hypothetical protein